MDWRNDYRNSFPALKPLTGFNRLVVKTNIPIRYEALALGPRGKATGLAVTSGAPLLADSDRLDRRVELPLRIDGNVYAYFLTGDTPRAIQYQRKTLELLPADDSAIRREHEERLVRYEAEK